MTSIESSYKMAQNQYISGGAQEEKTLTISQKETTTTLIPYREKNCNSY